MNEEFYNRHYITTRSDGAITDAWSDGPHPEKDTETAICINEQGGYQFRLYPGGEENPPIYDMDGIPLYKWDGSQVVSRTEHEIKAERAAIPAPPPSAQEQLRAEVDKLAAAQSDTANISASSPLRQGYTSAGPRISRMQPHWRCRTFSQHGRNLWRPARNWPPALF